MRGIAKKKLQARLCLAKNNTKSNPFILGAGLGVSSIGKNSIPDKL